MITLEEGEQIELVIRKHWFILAIEVAAPIIAAILIVLMIQVGMVTLMLNAIAFDAFTPAMLVSLNGFLTTLVFLAAWIAVFVIWTNYYLDYWVITNRRVLDVEQLSLFVRDASSFRLERIQDITTEVHGIIATLLHFGTIHVQTAGESRQFKMKGVPHPEQLKQFISASSGKAREDTRAGL